MRPFDPIRWGLLAPGAISHTFAAALETTDGAVLAAVGSRDRERARAFAERHGIARAYGSYEELADDPGLDAIYVGTPHSRHERDAILCLERGKHVLCEKPLALSAAQAGRMFDAARANDRLLMEAMWTRFLPSLQDVRRRLAAGEIGEPRLLQCDFGFRARFDPAGRLFAPELGGGALLDLGVYSVSLAHWLFGPPEAIAGAADLGPTGVDDHSAFVLHHPGGRLAQACQSLRVETPREAVVYGTDGWLRLHEPWWGASRVTLKRGDHAPEILDYPLRGQGYAHMADAFMELVRRGARASDVIPPADSLTVLATMDELRRQWGLRYPGE